MTATSWLVTGKMYEDVGIEGEIMDNGQINVVDQMPEGSTLVSGYTLYNPNTEKFLMGNGFCWVDDPASLLLLDNEKGDAMEIVMLAVDVNRFLSQDEYHMCVLVPTKCYMVTVAKDKYDMYPILDFANAFLWCTVA